jgi:hypothetical protein
LDGAETEPTASVSMVPLHLETLVPVVLGCLILWLVGRGLRWIAWVGACAITLLVIFGVLQVARGALY